MTLGDNIQYLCIRGFPDTGKGAWGGHGNGSLGRNLK